MEVRRIRATGGVGAPRVVEGLACHAEDFLLRIIGRPSWESVARGARRLAFFKDLSVLRVDGS